MTDLIWHWRLSRVGRRKYWSGRKRHRYFSKVDTQMVKRFHIRYLLRKCKPLPKWDTTSYSWPFLLFKIPKTKAGKIPVDIDIATIFSLLSNMKMGSTPKTDISVSRWIKSSGYSYDYRAQTVESRISQTHFMFWFECVSPNRLWWKWNPKCKS